MDEDVFINLSKWSANQVGIAHLNAVYSQDVPFVGPILGWPSLPVAGVLGEKTSEHPQASGPWLPLEHSRGH